MTNLELADLLELAARRLRDFAGDNPPLRITLMHKEIRRIADETHDSATAEELRKLLPPGGR